MSTYSLHVYVFCIVRIHANSSEEESKPPSQIPEEDAHAPEIRGCRSEVYSPERLHEAEGESSVAPILLP